MLIDEIYDECKLLISRLENNRGQGPLVLISPTTMGVCQTTNSTNELSPLQIFVRAKLVIPHHCDFSEERLKAARRSGKCCPGKRQR